MYLYVYTISILFPLSLGLSLDGAKDRRGARRWRGIVRWFSCEFFTSAVLASQAADAEAPSGEATLLQIADIIAKNSHIDYIYNIYIYIHIYTHLYVHIYTCILCIYHDAANSSGRARKGGQVGLTSNGLDQCIQMCAFDRMDEWVPRLAAIFWLM